MYDDYIDEWIIGLYSHDKEIHRKYDNAIENFDKQCTNYIEHHILWKKHKFELYKSMRNEATAQSYKMFNFKFNRNQTRYKQVNYQRYPYTVKNTVCIIEASLNDLIDVNDELKEIDYETTRTKWCSKNQRKLMTKELKDAIKKRDNYTCQICGKYMPDSVGLHIDHIIPIKKGGKSVESNLQVLCDKCNLHKSDK